MNEFDFKKSINMCTIFYHISKSNNFEQFCLNQQYTLIIRLKKLLNINRFLEIDSFV